MSGKKPQKNSGPEDDMANREGDVSDILGGLLGANAGSMPQGGASKPAEPGGAGGGADLMGMLGGLMGGGSAQGGASGGDLMGMLGGLLGGGGQNDTAVAANGPSLIQALLPLVLGMLGGGRSGQIDLDERSSNELRSMFDAAQSGESPDVDRLRSSPAVQDVAAQIGANPDQVATALAQVMQMLGRQG
jgi:hypothetical protein